MNSSESALDFIGFLTTVNALFRRTHIVAAKNASLRSVLTMIIPFKGEPSLDADKETTRSAALNAELCRHINAERKAIGMSLLLRRASGSWPAENEVVWSGENIGWDSFDSKALEADSVESLMVQVPAIVE